jgi:protein-S-isoprenylcysteine O-methyltransferase Ste14
LSNRRSLAGWLVPGLFALAAALTALHTAGKLEVAVVQPSARAWLVVLYGVLRTAITLAFAAFTVGRALPRRPAREPIAFLSCALAIGAILVFAEPHHGTPDAAILAGDVIAVAACTWLLASVLALGKCFGVLPEARGLVTAGPYNIVRHPVYLGEIGACTGLAVAAPTPANAVILTCFIAAQTMRMHLEEKALERAFPEYAEYRERTPRLIPRPPLPKRWLAGTDLRAS